MVYVGIAILLCLLFWQWRQKMTVVLLCCIGACILLFVWSVLDRKMEEEKLSAIPCAVINAQIGAKEVTLNERGEPSLRGDDSFMVLRHEEVSKSELLSHAVQQGLMGENSAGNIQLMDKSLHFLKDKNDEYYLNDTLVTNSLFAYAHAVCKDADIAVLILNSSDVTLGNEKMRISARRRNHSTNIMDISDRDLWEDRLIRPGESAIFCRKLANFRRQYRDLSDVNFEVQVMGVKEHKE